MIPKTLSAYPVRVLAFEARLSRTSFFLYILFETRGKRRKNCWYDLLSVRFGVILIFACKNTSYI